MNLTEYTTYLSGRTGCQLTEAQVVEYLLLRKNTLADGDLHFTVTNGHVTHWPIHEPDASPTAPWVTFADVYTATAGLNDGTGPDRTVWVEAGVLYVAVPSAGGAMAFGAALAAEMVISAIDDNEDVDRPAVAASRAIDIAARACTGARPGPAGWTILSFPGVDVT